MIRRLNQLNSHWNEMDSLKKAVHQLYNPVHYTWNYRCFQYLMSHSLHNHSEIDPNIMKIIGNANKSD